VTTGGRRKVTTLAEKWERETGETGRRERKIAAIEADDRIKETTDAPDTLALLVEVAPGPGPALPSPSTPPHHDDPHAPSVGPPHTRRRRRGKGREFQLLGRTMCLVSVEEAAVV